MREMEEENARRKAEAEASGAPFDFPDRAPLARAKPGFGRPKLHADLRRVDCPECWREILSMALRRPTRRCQSLAGQRIADALDAKARGGGA